MHFSHASHLGFGASAWFVFVVLVLVVVSFVSEPATLCVIVAVITAMEAIKPSDTTASTVLRGTRVVSSGAPSPFNRISRSRCRKLSL